MKWLNFFLTQKLRLDLAASFLVFVNFGLLIITASDKIMLYITTLSGKTINTYLLIPLMFIGLGSSAWIFGYFLDRFLNYLQVSNTVNNSRNPQILQILENQKEIKKQLNEILYGETYNER